MSELLAPNGKPSNLTPEQYKLVRTPAFKKWFGDWEKDPENASKVVDNNGEPKVCYHTTDYLGKINVFNFSEDYDFQQYGFGVYFTDDKKHSESYFEGEKYVVYEVFLNLKNPIILNQKEKVSNRKSFLIKREENNKAGAIIYHPDRRKWNYFITGEPNQIKLADGTNTTFDGSNPDIRFNDGGSVLLAPNGEPSNLTPEQYKLVRTPAFKEWFGDWEKSPKTASKVIDDNGEPLVVYRGGSSSNKKGYVFKTGYNRMGYLDKSRLPNQYFHYFVDKYSVADEYAKDEVLTHNNNVEHSGKGKIWESKVTSYFLNIKKPIDLTPKNPLFISYEDYVKSLKKRYVNNKDWFKKEYSYEIPYEYGFYLSSKSLNNILEKTLGNDYLVDEYNKGKYQESFIENFEQDEHIKIIYSYFIEKKDSYYTSKFLHRFYVKMIENKFDGLVFLEDTYWDGGFYGDINKKYKSGELKYDYKRWVEKPKVFACLESNQIKLADGTNTDFDSINPDIRFDNGGSTEKNYFKSWFKNSKVVDEKGNPLIVYHGSPDLRGLKENYIFESRFSDNKSFFFTDNYSMAKSYADPKRAFDYQNAEEGVIGLYLSLQNPLIVNALNQIWRKFEIIIDGNEIVGTKNLIKFAKDKGYDGVVVQNVRDYYNENDKKIKGGNVYVAFEPNQIKLADGTNTTFDSGNPDIRFNDGGEVKTGLFAQIWEWFGIKF